MDVHSGHRGRMKDKFRHSGFDYFADHEILETLLYFTIPRRDTNPLAHLLLDAAGSLDGIGKMDFDRIAGTCGCGEYTAGFLGLIYEAGKRGFGAVRAGVAYSTEDELRRLVTETVAGERSDATYLLLFDNKCRLITSERVFSGYYAGASFRAELVAQPALFAHASMAVLVSTHVGRIARPDKYEIETSGYLAHALNSVGVRLIDHYIVSGNVCLSVSDCAGARLRDEPMPDFLGTKVPLYRETQD